MLQPHGEPKALGPGQPGRHGHPHSTQGKKFTDERVRQAAGPLWAGIFHFAYTMPCRTGAYAGSCVVRKRVLNRWRPRFRRDTTVPSQHDMISAISRHRSPAISR